MGFAGFMKGFEKERKGVSSFKERGGVAGAAGREFSGSGARKRLDEQMSFLHGGKVKKKGSYRLHAGERVLNKKQTAKWERER
jgi:hypothetical protein